MSATARGGIFVEAAERLQIRPVMVEKDFWVSWTLAERDALFATVQYRTFHEEL